MRADAGVLGRAERTRRLPGARKIRPLMRSIMKPFYGAKRVLANANKKGAVFSQAPFSCGLETINICC